MRIFSSISAIVFILLVLPAFPSSAASIMVNEYKNSNGSALGGAKMIADEYMEFVLTQSMTVAELSALTFGDSNDTTSTLQGVFRFDSATLTSALSLSGLSSFLAGTIIVVKGNSTADVGAQDTFYNPVANRFSDDAWNLQLVAGAGAKDHPETLINGDINIAGQGDVVWISSGNPPASATDTSGFISAIGHDNSPGAIANAVTSKFGAGSILSATIGAPKTVYNTADSVVSLASSNVGSMGIANGGTNTVWINTLRGIPEPSRVLLLLAGLQPLLFRRRRVRSAF